MSGRTCLSCSHWHAAASPIGIDSADRKGAHVSIGTCQAQPPKTTAPAQAADFTYVEPGTSYWPETASDRVCGAWSARSMGVGV
jgi:hypothetical protein